jgi:tight adherence protein C
MSSLSGLAQALQLGALLLAFSALALGAYAVTSAPSHVPHHLGLRGFKRTQMLRHDGVFARFEPLMRWLSTRVSGLLSPRLRAHLDQQIVLAGDVWGLEPEDCVALCLLCACAGVLLGTGYAGLTQAGPFLALVAGGIGLLSPYLQLMSVAQARLRRIQLGLPHVVDLLALSLGAGLDFPAAVRQVVEKASRPDEPLMEELGLLLQECNLGRTRREALEKFAARAPCEAVRELVGAVVQSEEQGTPLAAVLKIQASSSRARRGVLAEETASRAGAALIIPLVLLFACILLLILAPMFLRLGPTLVD